VEDREPIYEVRMCAGLWKEIDSKQAEIERAQGDHVRIVYAAPQQHAQSAEQDERAAFEAAYNAGWDAFDACDNAYNNGTSEQLSVPGQSHEPEVFQRWRAEWFSNRDEVITQLLSTRAASTQSTAPQPAGWQPIETAPKDGTEVLLIATRHSMLMPHPEMIVGAYRQGWWSGPSTLSHVTHWMHLPDTPDGAKS
jgi:hypothetical protein